MPRQDWRKLIIGIVCVLAILLGMAALWRFTPAAEWLDIRRLVRWVRPMRDSPWAPAIIAACFIIGAFVMLPMTLLIIVTALAFNTQLAFFYSYFGVMAAALATYAAGRWLGHDAMRRLAKSRLDQINRYLERRGFLTMVILSVFPIAPFTIVNMAAGASRIHFRDYFIGSAIGLLPGTLIAVLLKYQLYSTWKQPSGINVGFMAAVVAIVVVVLLLLRGRIRQRLDKYFALNEPG